MSRTTELPDAFAMGTTRPKAGHPAAGHYDSTRAAVSGVLTAVLAGLPEETTMVLLVDAYSRWAARRFARRCNESGRQVRPSDSTGLESSELVRALKRRGPCYLVGGVGIVGALRLVRGMAARGPVVLCRITPLDTDSLTDPGCTVIAAVVTADSTWDSAVFDNVWLGGQS